MSRVISTPVLRKTSTLLLFLGIFILIGGSVLFANFPKIVNALQSRAWAFTTATIERSKLTEQEGENSTNYKVEVLYNYQVNGQFYQNHIIYFGYQGNSHHHQQAHLQKQLSTGSKFAVFYDPSHPEKSTLSNEIYPQIFILPCFGALFSALPVSMLLILLYQKYHLHRVIRSIQILKKA